MELKNQELKEVMKLLFLQIAQSKQRKRNESYYQKYK